VVSGADREYFADKDKVESLARALTTPRRSVSVQRDEEHNRYLLHVDDRSNGYSRQHMIGVDFVTAAEYRTLLANRRDIPPADGEIVVKATAELPDDVPGDTEPQADGTVPSAARAAPEHKDRAAGGRREKPADVRLRTIDELVNYFVTAGKKGIAVNRYKGLGEMNPDQLWETTMNPAARTLLQVRAEDHTEADLMFTTLMGDQVEPRRRFIEDNALDVKNLDV
jgi:DNA gyrase subunit B